jgi:hypothetical protein
VDGEAGSRHTDRLHELAVLAELLRKLREEPGAWIPLEPASEFVDAGVSHDQNVSGPAPGPGPASRHCARAAAYHRCKMTTLRTVKLYSITASK